MISRIATRIMIAASAMAAMAVAASGQSEPDFITAFSGSWTIHDPSFGSADGKCSLDLKSEGQDGRHELESANCGGELKAVVAWGLADGQLALLGAKPLVVARLGGNQRRITGTTATNKPLILDRNGTNFAADPIKSALAASGCYFLGFTDKCAPKSELGNPLSRSPAPAKKIKTLVNLNVRAEARDDATVIGVVPQQSCISVETCLTASDGVWCQAKFGSKTGWLAKMALRQDRWPVITFADRCDGAS